MDFWEMIIMFSFSFNLRRNPSTDHFDIKCLESVEKSLQKIVVITFAKNVSAIQRRHNDMN